MEISEKIKNAGLKVTQPRILVYQTMCSLGHSALDTVITRIRAHHTTISVATIYRIMELFCDSGLLLKFVGPQGKIFFDITPYQHLHFFTSQQGIVDIDDSTLQELIHDRLSAQLPMGECLDKISICITTKAI